MFQLKEYQKTTLDKLQKYLELTRFKGADGAFMSFIRSMVIIK